MKNNNKLILIVSLVGVIIFTFYLFFVERSIPKPIVSNIDIIKTQKEVVQTAPSLLGTDTGIDKTEIINKNEKKVILEVLGNTYTIEIKDNDSVLSAMNILDNDNKYNFNFGYKKYPSLGIFIDEINGIKGGSGGYWIYYVNGKEASVGVSNYILKEGDSILWKQE